MKIRCFLLCIALLTVPLLSASCGDTVSQQEYDKLQSDLASLQEDYNQLETQYQETQTNLSSLWNSFSTKVDLLEYIINYWAIATTGDEETIAAMTLNMGQVVSDTDEDELIQLWQEAGANMLDEDEEGFMLKFMELMNKAVELAEVDRAAIEAELAQ